MGQIPAYQYHICSYGGVTPVLFAQLVEFARLVSLSIFDKISGGHIPTTPVNTAIIITGY